MSRWSRIPEHPDYLDSHAAARYIGVTDVNLRTLVKRGKLRRVGVRNRRAVFMRADLDAWLSTR